MCEAFGSKTDSGSLQALQFPRRTLLEISVIKSLMRVCCGAPSKVLTPSLFAVIVEGGATF
jgi:hypothetical protein